ncbi:E3 ubiquitin-protein ligase RNF31 [Liparis tanakae]|uniref:E3 ubiquitin-protein ligase RNF31 n=1 Tax=Liparis tanakae TaxID=230148 RepID=A0A4Z2F5H9_9TELE|nr:E3 ubiquitin-protein ligase RNF31 [Liparis tanakae]
MSSPESVQMEELRRRSQALLSSSGSAQDVKAEVQTMAALPLPLSEKYRHLGVEAMLAENTTCRNSQEVLESLSRLVKALSILEKYGCNLTSPARPRYWRSVKHNNPVFRTTVDAIKGRRTVLFLYGYTSQQSDGLSFPDDVTQPDAGLVAAVTLEVMTLRTEVDLLLKGTHPHPGNFRNIIPFILQQRASAACAAPPPPWSARHTFCDACDDLFHRLPARANHKRAPPPEAPPVGVCTICGVGAPLARCGSCSHALCDPCDALFHAHPDHRGHRRGNPTSSPSLSPWACARCTTVNEMRAVLCATCERPRLAAAAAPEVAAPVPTSPSAEWRCRSCTVANAGSSILCEVCERPRLATRPHAAAPPPGPAPPAEPGAKWMCQYCTYVNPSATGLCEMCNLSSRDSAGASLPRSLQQTKDQPPPEGPRPPPEGSRGLLEGPQLGPEAERRGVSAEEVYAAICMCGGSNANPCDWLTSELPHLLDEICAMAASVQVERGGEEAEPSGAKPSRAEAKAAWLAARGDTERAVRQLLRDRQVKMKELLSLGFREAPRCEEALRLSGGEVKGALSLLQRPLLEPFHQRIWADQPEPPIDPKHPDKQVQRGSFCVPGAPPGGRRVRCLTPGAPPPPQRTCRRLLALYDLPSWGRCELVLALLQEPDVTSSLEDVVQAVKESQDKDFIRRLLINECPCCLSNFPRSKMQSLTSCQCSVCHECFGQHFTVAVRDRHIRDMVCPVCGEPDINESEQLDSYFSTLDIQLRNCLEADVYDLFHKKLTEHALMKDPKFLWCCHVSHRRSTGY